MKKKINFYPLKIMVVFLRWPHSDEGYNYNYKRFVAASDRTMKQLLNPSIRQGKKVNFLITAVINIWIFRNIEGIITR